MEMFLVFTSAVGMMAAMLLSMATSVETRKPYVYNLGIAVALLAAVTSVLRACLTDNSTVAGSAMVTAVAAMIFAFQIVSNRRLAKFEEELEIGS